MGSDILFNLILGEIENFNQKFWPAVLEKWVLRFMWWPIENGFVFKMLPTFETVLIQFEKSVCYCIFNLINIMRSSNLERVSWDMSKT